MIRRRALAPLALILVLAAASAQAEKETFTFDKPHTEFGFPEITFKSTKIVAKDKDAYDVTGDLTMRGVTKPVVLTVTANGFASDGRGGQKVGFDVAGKINRKDFGVNWNSIADGNAMLSDDVDILITVEANKKKAEAPAAAPTAPATK